MPFWRSSSHSGLGALALDDEFMRTHAELRGSVFQYTEDGFMHERLGPRACRIPLVFGADAQEAAHRPGE